MQRSYLMVAGDKEKQLRKIPNLSCDVAMINLEDGVANKEYALNLINTIFNKQSFQRIDKEIVIRVNGVDEGGLDEIKALNHLMPNGIRVAKIKSLDEIEMVLEVLDKNIDLHLSIETKEIFDVLSSIKIDKRITTVYLGILDLLESLKIPQSSVSLDNPMIDYLLSRFLIDAKIAGVYPVGFMYQEYANIDQYKKWCMRLKKIGFSAISCLGPKQVDIANLIFDYDSFEIIKAKAIKKLFEENRAKGVSGFDTQEYGFIDEPIYRNALLVLEGIKY